MDVLQFIDETILLAINGFNTPFLDTIFIYATWLGWPFFWVFLSLVIFGLKKDRQSLGIFILAMVSVIIMNIDLKFLFNRPRPAMTRVLVTETSPSFPSGHTSIAWCGAAALNMRRKRVKLSRYFAILLYLVAVTVTYSRMYLGVHYPLDVLIAMLEAIVISRTWNMAAAAYDKNNYQFLMVFEVRILDICQKIIESLLTGFIRLLNWTKSRLSAAFVEKMAKMAKKISAFTSMLNSRRIISEKSFFWLTSVVLLVIAAILGLLGYVLFSFEEPLVNLAVIVLSAGDLLVPETEISHEFLETMMQLLAGSAAISFITPFILICIYFVQLRAAASWNEYHEK
ncbi:MAG: phosphatase PAP2 family protein [Candidatus Odinarchaeota archaeon]